MDKLKNGIILGAIAGFLLTAPSISSWFADFLGTTLPASFQFLGSLSIPFYGILIGIIAGYYIDKFWYSENEIK